MSERWAARPMTLPKPWDFPPKVILSGPELANLVQEALFDIALSIHDQDGRAERWTDYVLAVGRLHADNGDVGEEATETLAGKVADAFAALAEDVGTELFLDPAEARLIAHQLDDVAGRIGVQR